MQLQLNQLSIQQGAHLFLSNINWDEFEQILDELQEEGRLRITYYEGMLEIMVPLPGHENRKEIIGDLVKALLEELDIEFAPMGSSRFKRKLMKAGIEPDACFYVQNEAAVRGMERIDLDVSPPPDLAIEIDITSDSQIKKDSYRALGVPELWIYDGSSLEIYVLFEGQYMKTLRSQVFSNLPVSAVIPNYLSRSRVEGRNALLKDFRHWVKNFLGK